MAHHNVDSGDLGAITLIMGVTNVITPYLPGKFSRLFPLIPLVLGLGWGFLKEAGSMGERVGRALSGLLAIGQYSLVRNGAGTKPADAPKA